jgi:hypothetical protein
MRGTFDPSKLDIRSTPDGERDKAERLGTRFRMGVSRFLYNLFETNEHLPRLKKMTDAEIVRQIVVEYRQYKDTVKWYSENRNAVTEQRSHFNRGILSPIKGDPPMQLSYRYDSSGHPTYRGSVMKPKGVERFRAHWTAVHYEKIDTHPRLWYLPLDHPLVIDEREKYLALSQKIRDIKAIARIQNNDE